MRNKLLQLFLLLLVTHVAQAQAPAWSLTTVGGTTQSNGLSYTRATAVDASGNVFVTGYFSRYAYFGAITLTSLGSHDIFVAKYVPATGTWAWAQRAGGTGIDQGYGIAVSGNRVYVTGKLYNDQSNTSGVSFGDGSGTSQYGVSSLRSDDLFVAKYTDNGASATLNWTQIGGGNYFDEGNSIAVNGSSVYVTGIISNDRLNSQGVLFGGAGTQPGTAVQYGATSVGGNDLVVAKYTDHGNTATLAWTQVGGGAGGDAGWGIAASGNSVYVTGGLDTDGASTQAIVFGGAGATPGAAIQGGVRLMGNYDIVVVKYFDTGPSAMVAWVQVGGGAGFDCGYGIAVSGSSVYVAGNIANDLTNSARVLFGGVTPQYGASAIGLTDIIVAKYTDNSSTATLNWTQVGGGTGNDIGTAIAVNGHQLYVTGAISNDMANTNRVLFGGTGMTRGTAVQVGASTVSSTDIVLASYTDNGQSATLDWTQVGGGTLSDAGFGVAVHGSSVYVGGSIAPVATFGGLSVATPFKLDTHFLSGIGTPHIFYSQTDTFRLYPNPAHGTATVRVPAGAGPATLTLLDAQGRVVRTQTAAASTDVAFDLASLAPGVYALRVQAGEAVATQQLLVE